MSDIVAERVGLALKAWMGGVDTATTVAGRARLQVHVVQGVLDGTHRPCPRELERLARAVGTTPEELIGDARSW